MKVLKSYMGIVTAFLFGAFIAATIIYPRLRYEQDELADQAVIAIASGINHATWIRTGRTQEVLEASEEKMLRAARLAVKKYPSHPGIGYYLERVETYCNDFSLRLNEEDREMLRSRPPIKPGQDKFFYHFPD
jgi:hypothetical protein